MFILKKKTERKEGGGKRKEERREGKGENSFLYNEMNFL